MYISIQQSVSHVIHICLVENARGMLLSDLDFWDTMLNLKNIIITRTQLKNKEYK
jgi:hypothetical protein